MLESRPIAKYRANNVVSCFTIRLTMKKNLSEVKTFRNSDAKVILLITTFIFHLANGGWSGFGSYSSCSSTCGDGTKTRTRSCTNPTPFGGGSTCLGSNTQTIACNLVDCPGESR